MSSSPRFIPTNASIMISMMKSGTLIISYFKLGTYIYCSRYNETITTMIRYSYCLSFLNTTYNLKPKFNDIVIISNRVSLFSKKLPHLRFPSARFIDYHPSILRFPPRKPIAMASYQVHKIFFRKILYLL